MPRRARVDVELVRRGLARSRQQAAELIGAGKVSIDGMLAVKPGTAVAITAALSVADDTERIWVSRGARKLIGALDTFGTCVDGRRCLDVGASTGGFTEVLLDRGAREVVAADVGYGQLAWSLRSDPRVVVVERTNARNLSPAAIGGVVDVIVVDLSFISLTTVLPALIGCASHTADIVPMVKPQFEVGKGQVGPGGVVRDPELRAGAVLAVARHAEQLDWHTVGVTASPLPGPSGNVEYFLWLRADDDAKRSFEEERRYEPADDDAKRSFEEERRYEPADDDAKRSFEEERRTSLSAGADRGFSADELAGAVRDAVLGGPQ